MSSVEVVNAVNREKNRISKEVTELFEDVQLREDRVEVTDVIRIINNDNGN